MARYPFDIHSSAISTLPAATPHGLPFLSATSATLAMASWNACDRNWPGMPIWIEGAKCTIGIIQVETERRVWTRRHRGRAHGTTTGARGHGRHGGVDL